MSHSSVVGQLAHSATHLSDWDTAHGAGQNPFINYFSPLVGAWARSADKKQPALQQAGPAPDPGAITQGALQNQVGQEASRRWAQTAFGSSPASTSLLDSENDTSKPNTASRVLLGGS